jgi:putative transposase
VEGRKVAQSRRDPGNRLTAEEAATILALINQPRFASLSPAQIVPILADEGVYLTSGPSTGSFANEDKWPTGGAPRS